MKNVRLFSIMWLAGVSVGFISPRISAQEARSTVIHLKDFGGRPAVDVSINDQGPYLFILDTGSRSMIIEDSLARVLGMQVVGTSRVGAPGSDGVDATTYLGTDLRIGDFTLTADEFIGIQGLPVPSSGERYYGIVSFWSLGRGTSELNLSQSTLAIHPNLAMSGDDPATLSLSWNPPFPFPTFPINVAGRKLEAHLDTGNPSDLVLDSALMDSLALEGSPVEIGRARMVGRESVVYGARLAGEATVGGVTVHNPDVRFIERIPGANVGSGLLRNAVVRIDHENNLIQILPSPKSDVRSPTNPD